MRYSRVRNADDFVLITGQVFPSGNDPRTQTDNFGTGYHSRWHLYVQDPALDPSTGAYDTGIEYPVLNIPSYVTGINDDHHATWDLIPFTTGELADMADKADREARKEKFSRNAATLRAWYEDSTGIVVTNQNNTSVTQTTMTRLGLISEGLSNLISGLFLDR